MRAARFLIFSAILAIAPILAAAPSQAAPGGPRPAPLPPLPQCAGGAVGVPILNAPGGPKFLCFPGAHRLPKSQRPTYAEAAKARRSQPVLRVTKCPKGRHHIKYGSAFVCVKNAPKAAPTPKPTLPAGLVLPKLKSAGKPRPVRPGGEQPGTQPAPVRQIHHAPPAKPAVKAH